MYEARLYRDSLKDDRFSPLKIVEEESDLWIGIDKKSASGIDLGIIRSELVKIRSELKLYILQHADFLNSMKPLEVIQGDTAMIKSLKHAGKLANTGPMAGIAGFVSQYMLKFILDNFQVQEIIIENGGDISLKISEKLNVGITAGENNYFGKLGIEILPSDKIIGICSSSGMFGHSFSFGKADLVSVVSYNSVLADTWATSIANKIKEEKDIANIENVLPEGIHGILAIKERKMFYKSKFQLVKMA